MDLVETKPATLLPQIDGEYDPEHLKTFTQKRDSASAIYVEIGSGSGGHLIGRALKQPDALFIGFELRYKRAFRTAEKAEKEGLTNLVVVRGDAQSLPTLFENSKVDGYYINFPDPWGKKHWKKHRLINTEYLQVLHRYLRPGGFLAYKTDHHEYFLSGESVIRDSTLFEVTERTEDLHSSEYLADNITTEFESLFLSKGLPICFLRAVRSAA